MKEEKLGNGSAVGSVKSSCWSSRSSWGAVSPVGAVGAVSQSVSLSPVSRFSWFSWFWWCGLVWEKKCKDWECPSLNELKGVRRGQAERPQRLLRKNTEGFDYWLRENACQNSTYNLEEEKGNKWKKRRKVCSPGSERMCVRTLLSQEGEWGPKVMRRGGDMCMTDLVKPSRRRGFSTMSSAKIPWQPMHRSSLEEPNWCWLKHGQKLGMYWLCPRWMHNPMR
jgi:hypothetical protein